jgi:hypothetical protein
VALPSRGYRLASVLYVIAIASSVSAGPAIEAQSFRIVLPDGWRNDPQARPPAIKGPKGEIFQLSYTDPAAAEEIASVLRNVQWRQ